MKAEMPLSAASEKDGNLLADDGKPKGVQMKTNTYVNKRNENKHLLVRKYDDGHTVVKQFMEWDNGVRNYTGCRLRSRHGRFSRMRQTFLREVLEDYDLLEMNTQGHGRSIWAIINELVNIKEANYGTV